MNRYWLLNGTLLAVAVIASHALLNHDARARWRLPAALRQPIELKPPTTATEQNRLDVDALRPTYSQGIDTLWQRSLFCKDRTEVIKETAEEEEPPEPTPEEEGLELVGIGIIGTKAAAIILITPKTAARRPTPTSRRTTMRGRKSTTKPPTKQRSRHVYRCGDKVGETGWTVREILFDFVEEKGEDAEADEGDSTVDAVAAASPPAKTPGAEDADGENEDGENEDGEDADGEEKPPPKQRRKTGIVILESGERTLELVLSSGDAHSESRRDKAAMGARQRAKAPPRPAEKPTATKAPRVLKPTGKYGPGRPPPHPGQLLRGGVPGGPPAPTAGRKTSGPPLTGTAAQRRQELREDMNRLRSKNAGRYQKPTSPGTRPK